MLPGLRPREEQEALPVPVSGRLPEVRASQQRVLTARQVSPRAVQELLSKRAEEAWQVSNLPKLRGEPKATQGLLTAGW